MRTKTLALIFGLIILPQGQAFSSQSYTITVRNVVGTGYFRGSASENTYDAALKKIDWQCNGRVDKNSIKVQAAYVDRHGRDIHCWQFTYWGPRYKCVIHMKATCIR